MPPSGVLQLKDARRRAACHAAAHTDELVV
jgi:hypothetical protein